MARAHPKALQSIDTNFNFNTPASHIFSRNRYLAKCVPLHQATMKGDWDAAQQILNTDPALLSCPITEGGETALHIAAASKQVSFAKRLVKMMNRNDLDIKNKIGNTALFFAAVTGTLEIAEVMVKKNDMLPTVGGCSGVMPLYMAAILGHTKMAEYLYPLSDIQAWNFDSKVDLLTTCITSDLFDLALRMIKDDNQLAMAQDKNRETPLHVLARKTSAFSTENEGGIRRRIKNLFGFIEHSKFLKLGSTMIYKMQYTKRSSRCAAFKLLRCLWEHTLQHEDLEIPNLSNDTSKLLFIATQYGNVNVVVELLRSYPDFIWKVDAHNRSIFHIAVMHRHECIFSLIYEIGSVKDLIATYRDNSDNTILHLAAALSPANQLNGLSGAALQMHRELLWFKEVEKIVQPSYRVMENANGDTPAMTFSKEHKELLEESKKWMRETTQSFMIIASLIAVVVFASSFSAPSGGINAKGRPIFLHKNLLTMIYLVSEGTAMCFSSISVIMFLSILTSHFNEYDFLYSLPLRLVIGVVTLLISLCAIMVDFCTCLLLWGGDGYVHGVLLYGTFASVPLMFILFEYSLVISIISPIYGSQYLFCSRKRLM